MTHTVVAVLKQCSNDEQFVVEVNGLLAELLLVRSIAEVVVVDGRFVCLHH